MRWIFYSLELGERLAAGGWSRFPPAADACAEHRVIAMRSALGPLWLVGSVAPDKMEKRAHDWNRTQASSGEQPWTNTSAGWVVGQLGGPRQRSG